jgi:hypothetical protein
VVGFSFAHYKALLVRGSIRLMANEAAQ